MERDLLIGVMALQLGFVEPEDLIEALSGWAANKAKPIEARLPLSAERRRMLGRLVGDAGARAAVVEADAQRLSVGASVHPILQSFGGLTAEAPPSEAPSPAEPSRPPPEPAAVDRTTAPTAEAGPDPAERYVVGDDAEIGRGGIGRVVKAFDPDVGREIAIKELLDANAEGERFLREARVTGQLEHPNIVPVYELGRRADGTLYYAMKLVRGRTLAEALEGACDMEARLRLLSHFLDLTNAIAYAHSRGVVHRDIKPANVMLGEFGETLVLDWGLAKAKGDEDLFGSRLESRLEQMQDSKATVEGAAIGTPAYMSPEQAEGRVDAIDERSDVWGLGVVLFEILTGAPPFAGASVYEVIGKVMNGAVPAVRDVSPEAPPDLAAVAQKALARDPAARYPDARALAEDVRAYLTGRRIAVYEYSSVELLKRFVAKNRLASLMVLAVLVAVLVGSSATFVAYREAEAAQALAKARERDANAHLSVAYVEKSELAAAEARFGEAETYAAAAALHSPYNPSSPWRYPDIATRDPTEVARARASLQSALSNARQSVLTLERTLRAHEADTWGVAFAADGRLVTGGEDGRVVLHAPNGDVLRTHQAEASARRVAISADGTKVAFVSKALRVVRVWDVVTGTVRLTTNADERHRTMAFSPDGARLAVAGQDADVVLYDTERLREVGRIRAPKPRALTFGAKRIAIGGRFGEVRIVDADSLAPIRTLDAGDSAIWSVALGEAGRVAAAGFEGHISVFDGDRQFRIEGADPIYEIAWSPDGRRLAAAGIHRGRLFEAGSGRLLQVFGTKRRGLGSVRWSPDGRRLATGGFGASVEVWSVRPTVRRRRSGHQPPIQAVAISGQRVATVDGAGDVRLWTQHNLTPIAKLAQPRAYKAAFVDEGLAVLGSKAGLQLWRGEAGTPLYDARETRTNTYTAVAGEGDRLVWTGAGTDVLVMDVKTKTLRAPLTGLGAAPTAVAVRGETVAAADSAGQVAVWRKGRLVTSLAADGHIVTGLAFSPDATHLAVSGARPEIRLVALGSGEVVRVFEGHTDWVNQVHFSPDGALLLSTSDDKTVRLWDVASAQVAQIVAVAAIANGAAFSRDGRAFAYGDGPNLTVAPIELDLWRQDARALVEAARAGSGLRLDGFSLVYAGDR